MPTFTAADGTRLAHHVRGDGEPLVLLPGGPMRASVYLGDLGGLAVHRRLILLDPRGTGDSEVPVDPATYRCDRLVDDVEILRAHIGLDHMDLLAHSGGGSLAMLYAARYPAGPERYAFEALRDDVRALLVALGIDRADIVGHSLGGMVAYLLAQEASGVVRRLVLEDVPAPVPFDPPRPPTGRPAGDLPCDWAMVEAADAQVNAPRPMGWDHMGRIASPRW